MIRLDGTDAEFKLRMLYAVGATNAMRIVSGVIEQTHGTIEFRAYFKLVDLLTTLYERGSY